MNCKPIVTRQCLTISEGFSSNHLFLSDEVLLFYSGFNQVKLKVVPLPNSDSTVI